jgi:hypothetical protein
VIRNSMLLLALMALALPGASCAVFDSDNRRTLNLLDEHCTPEEPVAKWALAPVALPTGLLAASVDAVIVHPVNVVGDAWGDTTELLWSSHEESSFRRAIFAPVAVIATPFVFVGDWLGRSAFAIPPREENEDSSGENRK